MMNPVIQKLQYGAELSHADRRRIEQLTSDVRSYGPREDLIREGERPDHMHAVLEGYACRYKVLADGGRQIMAWLVPGDLCDLHVSLLGQMDHSIAALSASRIAILPRREMEELAGSGGSLNRALWWSTLVDEGVLREWLVGMGRRPADKQIAHLFCELLVRLRSVGLADDDSFDLPVTQEELADTVGMSPVHINRVLQHLRQDGLITLQGRVLTILDFERLKAFAEFDPNYLHLEKRGEGSEPAAA